MISCDEMNAIDKYTIENIKIPSIVLMERASLQVLKNINPDLNNFTIIAGVGNNGGDGLALTRHLILKNKKVDLFIIGNIDKISKDSLINLNILKNLNFSFNYIKSKEDLTLLKKSLNLSKITIDSLLGTGLSRNITGIYKDTIETINKYSKYILSIDIPSGIDGDTGEILGTSINPDIIITFHMLKYGLSKFKNVIIEDIGIPELSSEYILNKKRP